MVVKLPEVQQQTNGFDCGVSALMFVLWVELTELV